MIRSVVLACFFIALAKGQSTEISQCINHGGELPINTYIEGCITPPCLLPQLQDVVINMVFRAPHTIRSMRTLATAYLLIIPIQYDLQDNAITCNFLENSYCPLLAGEVVQYTLKMYIESIFPQGTSVTIEFRVVDDNNVPFVCIRVPIRITAPVGRNSLHNNSTLTIHV